MSRRLSRGLICSVLGPAARWAVIGIAAISLLPWATGAKAGEALLVHDISAPHPRLKYFDAMVAETANRSAGALRIAINPGGKILYPGKASLEAVRSGKAPLALINSAHLESVNPRIGFINQPFAISDEIMVKPGVAAGMIRLMNSYVESSGLQVLGLMRGADTIFIFKKHQIRRPEDLKGLKVRIAGPGVFQEMVRSFEAQPLVIPFIEIKAAMERGTVDGVLTSPGGWTTQFGLTAPNGTLAPGLIFMTYALVADKAWLARLPEGQKWAALDAARMQVTEKWADMQRDDSQLADALVKQGANFWVVPADQLAPWKARVEGMTKKFADSYPEVIQQYRAVLQSSGQ